MERKAVIILVVAAVAVIALLGAYTGWVTYHETAGGIVIGDSVSVPQSQIKSCCTFTDANGKERTCGVLAQYGCDYCTEFCSG